MIGSLLKRIVTTSQTYELWESPNPSFNCKMFKGVQMKETEHTTKSAVVVFVAEVISTAMLMFLGCMGGLGGYKDKDAPLGQGAVVFGMTVCSLIQMWGHVSGAHMNPVVSIAAWLWGSLSLPFVLIYFVAQMLGASFGIWLLAAITPDRYLNWGLQPNDTGAFCTTTVAPGVSTAQAFVGEFVVTAMLVMLCCGCWDARNKALQDGVALKFGVLVAAISISQGPATGASMNPARTFGPSLLFNKWDRHWVYWVAPLLAAVLVPLIYKAVFNAPDATNDTQQSDDNSSLHETIAISKELKS